MTGADELAPPEIPGLVHRGVLGTGGFSAVHLYERQMPRMQVAVKVLNQAVQSEGMRARFTSEADAMARIDHPCIVQVFSADIAPDGRPYIVLKYFPRPNLAARARDEGFSVPEVLSIGVQLAGAVETAHRAGILHRDIKPQNILTDQYNRPALTDFGIAATTAAARAGGPLGVSYPWSPPEAIFSSAAVDERSDVYSLAATLWHLLAGRSPFEIPGGPNDDLSLANRIRAGAPARLDRSDVPLSLDRLLRQAMSRDPGARPASALAFGRSLQSIEQEQRLPMTELVAATDAATPRPRPPSPDDEDATRRRRPAVVDAQPASAGPVRGDDADRRTTASRAGDDVPTYGPPVAPAAEPPLRPSAPPAAPRPALPRGRTLLAGAGALVVAAAVVTVVAVHGSGSSQGGAWDGAGGSSAAAAVLPSADVVVPPGMPRVTAKQLTPTTVQFSWTYSDPLADDTFRWSVDGGAPTTSATPYTDPPIQTRAGHPVCLSVIVIRRSGLVSPASTPTCSGG